MKLSGLILPAFFGVVAFAVWSFNSGGREGLLIFPLFAFVPGFEHPQAQAEATWKLFVLFAMIAATWTVASALLSPRAPTRPS